jgi:polyhydroxyalkanoate synthesis regulator phasin
MKKMAFKTIDEAMKYYKLGENLTVEDILDNGEQDDYEHGKVIYNNIWQYIESKRIDLKDRIRQHIECMVDDGEIIVKEIPYSILTMLDELKIQIGELLKESPNEEVMRSLHEVTLTVRDMVYSIEKYNECKN